MRLTRINDIVLHHRLTGAPSDGPVVVFINSLGTDFRIWDETVARLAGECATLVYDKRGHGLSDLGDARPGIAPHAADLAALLDHLAIKRAVICGLSIGGLIALQLYAARPDLVQAMILSDTAHKIGTAQSWKERIEIAETKGIAAFADGVMEKWFTPAFHTGRADELAGYRNMLIRQPVAGYVAACNALASADLTETAQGASVPALCIVGDQDGSTPPALVRSLADLVPGARYEVIEGAGHIPCVEQPEIFTALVSAFIRSQSLGS
ncbi:3-oxoadipate enol-lactonase [Mesorhizobium sp. NPDC059054]|uniref:3-oxoadipate enol-lactonase n=1 Tax=Mesorhizobium sp. NPDC059054 TaxID=3346711 RepID=UPI0036C36528